MSLAPGTNLGPYRILALLGRGGMGEVYRAEDPKLGRQVAIKVLPEGFAEDRERLKRFEQEAKALAALAHPNILAIHEFGTSGGTPYLVMELLEGRTLRQLMGEGPMAPGRAAELAEQVAAGLAAAHERGIVHRDLKPENLFVTADRVVKILDFGLAKVAFPERSEATTETGTAVGTVSYMSPEQACGTVVDPRSDQFSLGVVLYEMLGGRRPFEGMSAAETLAAIVRDDPRPLEALNPKVPEPLGALVRRCLAKDPAQRYASTRDLARALRGSQGRPGRGWKWRLSQLRPRSWLLVGAALALAAGLIWRASSRTRVIPSDPRCVVVLPFENRTGDPTLDALGRQVADLVCQDLQAVENLKVAVDHRPAEGWGDVLRRAAEEARARLVATGAIYRVGGELEFQAQVVDPWERRTAYTLGPWRGSRERPEAAVSEVRQWLAGAIAVAYSEPFDYDPGAIGATRLEAYLALMKAWNKRVGDYSAFLTGAREALRLDPQYYMARFCMVDVLFDSGRFEEAAGVIADMESGYEHCTPVERCVTRWLRADLEGRYVEALKGFDDLRALHRERAMDRFVRAQFELALNRTGVAVRHLASVPPSFGQAQGPAGWWVANYLGWAYHQARDYEGQLRTARENLAASPDVLVFRSNEVAALAALGRVEEVAHILEMLPSLQFRRGAGPPWAVRQIAMVELREHGHLEASRRVARGILTSLEDPGFEPKALIPRLRMEALAQLDRVPEALVLARGLVQAEPGEPAWKGWEGSLLARLGRFEEARAVDRDLAAMTRPYLYGKPTCQRAYLAAQMGERDHAVALLRQAFGEGLRYSANLHWRPEFDLMRGHPSFEELMRPKD